MVVARYDLSPRAPRMVQRSRICERCVGKTIWTLHDYRRMREPRYTIETWTKTVTIEPQLRGSVSGAGASTYLSPEALPDPDLTLEKQHSSLLYSSESWCSCGALGEEPTRHRRFPPPRQFPCRSDQLNRILPVRGRPAAGISPPGWVSFAQVCVWEVENDRG